MRRLPFLFLLAGFVFSLLGCRTAAPVAMTAVPTFPTATATSVPPTAAPTAVSPTPTAAPANTVRSLTILYTNDEHGWMEGLQPGSGAVELMTLWQETETYDPDTTLILSGGDMWTGPAISTWFEGESMAEVMNAMNYDAAAVGNHEFDFGLDTLTERAEASDFPFLSANMRYKADGQTPTELGIRPYIIREVNGIQVGIIGLTSVSTPVTTNPANVADFDFIDYETALRQVAPQVKAEGAELILVPAHICQTEVEQLAAQVADLGVHLIGGGHCNELFADEVDGLIVMEGGTAMGSYAYATIQFDTASDTVVDASYGVRINTGAAPDPVVAAIVGRWREEADAELNRVIGYTESGIERRSEEMQALITESWLWAYPAADVALTNLGGMRADIPPGDISIDSIVTVMPFDNVIVEVTLTGEQLEQVLRIDATAIGGLHRENFAWVLDESGAPIEDDAYYTVLVNDFMYNGGDNYGLLAVFDPAGYDTAINWRQPVLDWLLAQGSTPARPIDTAVQSWLD